ncbi:hypothetical protein BD309DRAFT_854786 [Dichomitus squalens]|nr:hypothetical protein BD309DRAFT_854786 [Dichomitus squalens]
MSLHVHNGFGSGGLITRTRQCARFRKRLSHISHRITWDAVHLPHLGSSRQEGNDRRHTLLVPPACRSRTTFTRLTSRHS